MKLFTFGSCTGPIRLALAQGDCPLKATVDIRSIGGGGMKQIAFILFFLCSSVAEAQLPDEIAREVRANVTAPDHMESVLDTYQEPNLCFDYRNRAYDYEVFYDLAQAIDDYCLPRPVAFDGLVFRPDIEGENWRNLNTDTNLTIVCGEGFKGFGDVILGDDAYVYIAATFPIRTVYTQEWASGSIALMNAHMPETPLWEDGTLPLDYVEFFFEDFACVLSPGSSIADRNLFYVYAQAAGLDRVGFTQLVFPSETKEKMGAIYLSETALSYDEVRQYRELIQGRVVVEEGTSGPSSSYVVEQPGLLHDVFPGYILRRDPDTSEQRDPDVLKREVFSCTDHILDPQCDEFRACLSLTPGEALSDNTCTRYFLREVLNKTPCTWLTMFPDIEIAREHPCYPLVRCTAERAPSEDTSCVELAQVFYTLF